MRYILSSYGDGIVVWFSSVSHQKITSTTVSVAIYATKSLRTVNDTAFQSSFSSEDEAPGIEEGDGSLDDAAEDERDYVRRRLRDELGREPSEEEMDEWLRRHTEGY
jgi:hypothetical protein